MERWQEEASRHLKMLTDNLSELLSGGLELLRSELGVDLGLKPELLPPWVLLLAAGGGLLLLLLLVGLWASVCRAVFTKRPAVSPADDGAEVKQGPGKTVKTEEPKKRKKKTEKKGQPNGRALSEPQEEALVSEEVVPLLQATEAKSDKVLEGKKSKKKAKQAVKESKAAGADGKEPEEGNWETKVSNKEKREQRKKDKTPSDGSSSPGGGNTPVSSPPEQPKAPTAPAAPPAPSQKKKKGESAKVKAEKVEPAVSEGNTSEVTEVAPAAPAVPDVPVVPVEAPAAPVAPIADTWTASREAASLWGAGIDESWTVIDRGMSGTELNLVTLSGLSVGTSESQPADELPWLGQPRVEDEWSGMNGSSVDPSSDWNAPSEAWGNYEEPTAEPTPAPEQPPPELAKADLVTGAPEDDEDDKDKGESGVDGAAKSKKKKKKKKKGADEGGTAGQSGGPEKEVAPPAAVKKQVPVQESPAAVQPVKAATVETKAEQPVKENKSQKTPVTQVPPKPAAGESTAKQNNIPPPAQQKSPEENQAPKPAKKKKARRET